jgi:hypothetical protein
VLNYYFSASHILYVSFYTFAKGTSCTMAGRSTSVFRISTRAPLAQLLILHLLISSALGRRFDSIDKCRARVIDANATTPTLNLTFMLTLPQCYEYCGTGYGTYDIWSVISALSSWVIPLFLLLNNVTYARISSSVFDIGKVSLGPLGNPIAVISHLLANPIDFLWSLSLKLDVGHQIKKRCYKIPELSNIEKKDLSSICFALEDFENGIHVDTLLEPLEDDFSRIMHYKAIYNILGPAAFDLAGARKHNKLHSTLAILIYGKEVFEALINARLDGTFPYHMPHTLALRQIYYWLFLAVILSSATGGFANQWTSHVILTRFLAERRAALESEMVKMAESSEVFEGLALPEITGSQEGVQWLKPRENIYGDDDIVLSPLNPWDGGNYSWRHPKDDVSEKSMFLLCVVLTAVAFPVVSAFLISWFVPTVGLGDRGILELSFAGLWLFNWALTHVVGKYWRGRELFRIMWWNLFWSLASLVVLFTAFQGEYLSSRSPSMFSRS